MSKFIENDLLKNSIVSFYPEFGSNTIKDEIFDPYSLLSKSAKQLIAKNIKKLSLKYTVDHLNIYGEFSAKLNIKLQQSALWNVVTETNFYHDKLHLTEKIFKPIVFGKRKWWEWLLLPITKLGFGFWMHLPINYYSLEEK